MTRRPTITVQIGDIQALFEALNRRLDLDQQWELTVRLMERWGLKPADEDVTKVVAR